MDLTATDRKLIAALTRDSRATVTTLAGMLGVSRATVQSSMEKLVGGGIIRRFTIEVDAAANTERICAIMSIEVQGNLTSSVVKALRRMPEVVSIHSTNGAWDLVAHIETSSLPEFDKLLRKTREISGILNSETSLLLNSAS